MTQDDFFDLSLEEGYDSFDPLADGGMEFDAEAPIESGLFGADPKEFPSIEQLAETTRQMQLAPVSERIESLFESMRPSRKILLAILDLCQGQARPNSEVTSFVEELKQNNKSVYSPDNLCMMLVRAGAMERFTEDGQSYEDVEASLEPQTVVIDGVEYLEPVEPPEIYWLTTADGAAFLHSDQPAARLRALLESEPQYRHIYRIVLEKASAPEGVQTPLLSKLIDNDPAVQRPRMYAMRFGDKLDEAEAIEWRDNAWRITDLGVQGLAMLDELDGSAQYAAE